MRTWIVVALIVLTLGAYIHVLGNDFVDLDDSVYVTANPHVLGGVSFENTAWAWTTLQNGFYLPITWMSLQLDATLYDNQPWGFHLTNLLLHTANVVLLFLLLQWLTGATGRSALVAALFAVHPMHVESVAWVCERKDVLVVFFWLLMIAAYAWYVKTESLPRYLVMMAAYVCGLLSKPMIVTAPCLLLLLDAWPLRRVGPEYTDAAFWRRLGWLVAEKIPLLLIAALSSKLTADAQAIAGAFVEYERLPLWTRFNTALVGYLWYLKTTFVPVGLAFYYLHPFANLSMPELLGASGILAGITWFVCWTHRRVPALLIGWLWFMGTLFPVIGFFQVGLQGWADRFVYFPHIGLFIALVWGSAALARRLQLPKSLLYVAAAGILAALAVLTWQQVCRWRDSESMWLQTTLVTTNNHRAHSHLGLAYARNGQNERAIIEIEKALAIYNHQRYHAELAQLYRAQGCTLKMRYHMEQIQSLQLGEAAHKQ